MPADRRSRASRSVSVFSAASGSQRRDTPAPDNDHDNADAVISADQLGTDITPVDKPGAKFRWSAQRYFLTYSQVGDAGFLQLTAIWEEGRHRTGDIIDQWGAVEETHKDGGHHWHLYLRFKKPLRNTGADLFDVPVVMPDGTQRVVHPNVAIVAKNGKRVATQERRVWYYMNKESASVGTFTRPDGTADSAMRGQSKVDAAYSHAMQAESREDFMKRVTTYAPRDAVLFGDRISAWADARYAPPKAVYIPSFTDFPNLPREITEWVDGEFKKADRPKSLVLIGGTRLGKTEWARSLGDHNYQGNMFNLDEFDASKDYIVLDDIDIDFFPSYKSWLGAQKAFNVTDKYRKKAAVKWGKPCIWLSNKDPREGKTVDRDWLNGNCVIVTLEKPLYEVPRRVVVPPIWPSGTALGSGAVGFVQRREQSLDYATPGPSTPTTWSQTPSRHKTPLFLPTESDDEMDAEGETVTSQTVWEPAPSVVFLEDIPMVHRGRNM